MQTDAIGNPIPEDLKCPFPCPVDDTPHTHVRGNWNRPGYSRMACSHCWSCENSETHFHKNK